MPPGPMLFARGRLGGLLALLIVLGVALGWGEGPPGLLRLALFDGYQRLLPRQPETTPAAIVAIDEPSLAAIGQWPWPRHVTAALIGRILEAEPLAVGVDILMPESDRFSPAAWAQMQPSVPADIAERLSALPSNDALLAATLRQKPVVLGIAGLYEAGGNPGRLAPARVFGGDALPHLPRYGSLRRSRPEIDGAAAGHGLLSVDTDRDGIVRQLPLVAAVGSMIAPGLAVEMLRVASAQQGIGVTVSAKGIEKVAVGPLDLPTEPDGSVWVRFRKQDHKRVFSAAQVMAGRVDPERFASGLVLVGVTGLGALDERRTPLGERVPGIEIHAQLIENLLEGTPLSRPRWAAIGEGAVLLIIGLVLIAAMPHLPPLASALLGAVILALLAAAGVCAFATHHLLIDVANPAAGGAFVFIAMLGAILAEANRHRRALAATLERERLEAARVSGELEAARRIQIGILPRADSLPADPRLEIAALMEPARTVGGDLYDFFLVDRDRLFVAVGDVSGKGIPASLFMAQSKALLKSAALRQGLNIDEIVGEANAEIARDNTELMFVTLCAALIDLRTGAAVWCSAGNDAPWSLAPGEAPRPLDSAGGPPLSIVAGFSYPAETHALRPGEILLLTTDGIGEAQDAAKALYGRDRLAAVLAALPAGATADQAVAAIRADVAAFVGEAEPADDLTLVAVRWLGAPDPAPVSAR